MLSKISSLSFVDW